MVVQASDHGIHPPHCLPLEVLWGYVPPSNDQTQYVLTRKKRLGTSTD